MFKVIIDNIIAISIKNQICKEKPKIHQGSWYKNRTNFWTVSVNLRV
jgi:hypothetical protein